MIHHITKLIAEGEHQQLDFKYEIADARKIAHTLVAFANTDGGRLLVGVKDNGALKGISSEEEVFMVENAALLYSRPPVEFTVREWNLNKKNILEVIIPKSAGRPHFAQTAEGKWVAYHRVKDQTLPVNRMLLRVWKLEAAPKGVYLKMNDPAKLLLAYLETNESITLAKFCRLAGISRNSAENILIRFLLLKMIRMEFTEQAIYFHLTPLSNSS